MRTTLGVVGNNFVNTVMRRPSTSITIASRIQWNRTSAAPKLQSHYAMMNGLKDIVKNTLKATSRVALDTCKSKALDIKWGMTLEAFSWNLTTIERMVQSLYSTKQTAGVIQLLSNIPVTTAMLKPCTGIRTYGMRALERTILRLSWCQRATSLIFTRMIRKVER